jgi:protein-tyrosine-phosphatase
MAAGLLRKRLADEGMAERHKITSAGVYALDDRPATQHAIDVMAERDIDIADHIAHTLNAADMAESDLILVMSQRHKVSIHSTWPQYDWKVHRLSEMAGKRRDVADPYGDAIGAYRDRAEEIARYIDEGLEQILKLA